MADIAELTVRIKADAAQLSAEMNKVNATVQQSSAKMTSSFAGIKSQLLSLAPAISAVAFVSFAKGALNAADRLNDLSQRTGVAASTLSALNIPLLQGGASVDEFASSITRMNNMIGEAAQGKSQDLNNTFDKLHLNIQALMQLSPEQQFYEIAKSLNEIKNQADFTNTGISIFGRSFATLAPLIRDSNGKLAEFVETQKKHGSALTEEQLARIDAWGDAWTSAIEHAKLGLLDFIDVITRVPSADDFLKANVRRDIYTQQMLAARQSGQPFDELAARKAANEAAGRVSSIRPDSVTEATIKASITSPNGKIVDTKAIDSARQSLRDYNLELARNQEMIGKTDQQKAGLEVYYKTLDLGEKAKLKNAKELAVANQKVAESIYEQKKAQEEAIRINDEWHKSLSSAITDAIVNFNSAADAAENLAKAIASMIIQRSIAEPLTNALVGATGTSGGGLLGGIISSLPSFDVGSPYIPQDMIAKIHQGEMIIPKVQADAMRSGSNGSSGITLVQNNNFASGVSRAEVANMLPSVAKAAHDAVFASIQRGGSAAKIVGVR